MSAPAKPETDEAETKLTGASALAARIAEMRTNLEEGKPLIPKADAEAKGEEDDATEKGGSDATKPDDEEGEGESRAGEEEGSGEASTEEDGAAEDEKPAEAEVEEGTEAEAAEGADAKGEKEEEEVDPELVVSLPPRREGDPEEEVVMPTKALAERTRQLVNAAMAGDQVRASRVKIEEAQAEIDEMETAISTDPVGFIVENVPAEIVEQVALALITTPEIFAKVSETLATLLNDSGELRVVQAEMQAARMTSKDKLRRIAETKKTSRETARKIVDGIELMVPKADGITETRHAQIIADVRQHVANAVKTQQLTALDPKDLPLLAAPALRQHGIDPLKAAEVLTRALANGGKPVGDSPPATTSKAKTGKQFKEARAKKKGAAAAVPAGGAAPAARPNLPKGQRLEDRIKLAREKGLGALLQK